MCSWFLFAAPTLPGDNQPYHFVGPHATHRTGGVHRPEYHTTAAEHEFCWLDEAAFTVPPGADHLPLLTSCPVRYRESQATPHNLPGLLEGVNTGGIDGGPQRFQFCFVGFVGG